GSDAEHALRPSSRGARRRRSIAGIESVTANAAKRPAMRILPILLSCLLLAACASSALVTGTPRAPIDPSQVRIYFQAPPGGYEEIALLESNSGAFTYGEQNKM